MVNYYIIKKNKNLILIFQKEKIVLAMNNNIKEI